MRQASKHVRNVGIVFTWLLVLEITTAANIQPVAAEDVRKAVEAGNAKWIAAFNQGDAAAVAALYTEGATLMPPNSEMIEGREGVQNFWHGAIQSGLKNASLTTVAVQASGETAYEIGKFSLTAHAQGQDPQVVSGKYVVVWQKGSDGAWKLHVDIWNSNMPAQ
jgi:uncharacterized protein (TIGR02246 family)